MSTQRNRIREMEVEIGSLPPGPTNAITDVPGVLVDHTTIIQGDSPLIPGKGPVRTGVTAIFNALTMATTMIGRDNHKVEALPLQRITQAFSR